MTVDVAAITVMTEDVAAIKVMVSLLHRERFPVECTSSVGGVPWWLLLMQRSWLLFEDAGLMG